MGELTEPKIIKLKPEWPEKNPEEFKIEKDLLETKLNYSKINKPLPEKEVDIKKEKLRVSYDSQGNEYEGGEIVHDLTGEDPASLGLLTTGVDGNLIRGAKPKSKI